MSYQYMILDSRSDPVAHATSASGPDSARWDLRVAGGGIKRVLSHEYVQLVSGEENGRSVEGRIAAHREGIVTVEAIRELGDEVRRNLRMPVRFESFIYPVSRRWKGRATVLSNDLSCGGLAFFCAKQLEVGETVQIVIPVTSQPILANIRILRTRPTGEPIPLYAASFVHLLHEEESMIREAVFGLQLRYTPET